MTSSISLNTDLGEGYGIWSVADDAALLDSVVDANVACGFHAGDPDIIRRTCRDAAARSVSVGAHPGFQDARGFGRRHVVQSPESVTNDVLYQLGALQALARAEDITVTYVKPHGALSHAAMADTDYARAIIKAVARFDETLPLLIQPATLLWEEAVRAGLPTVAEGFVDRGYLENGLLVPRGQPGALTTDVAAACERAVQLATRGEVTTNAGTTIPMPVSSICIHSDSPGSTELARAVRGALEAAGISVVSFMAHR